MVDNDETKDPLVLEIKGWMNDLLRASGLSKSALARAVGEERKNITNAYDPKMGLPRGTLFYKILRELGALKDAPADQETIPATLNRIEGLVETLIQRADVREEIRYAEENLPDPSSGRFDRPSGEDRQRSDSQQSHEEGHA